MSNTRLRGKIGETKVKRYWPGKAPEWAKESDQEEDHVRMHKVNDNLGFSRKDDDPRLRRLAQASRTENREEVEADHRRIRQAEIIWTKEELRHQVTIDEEEDEDALEERRRRIREKNLNRAQEEEEEDEEEYESDWEEDMSRITMIKPVFVRKPERDTITERERLEAEEEALEELAKRKLEMRKLETKQIVVEEVRKYEENILLEEEANIGDVETDDEIDEAEEYNAWMTREFARIKRERDDPKEAQEIEKLRNMTEQERREWERKNAKEVSSLAQPKKKRKLMQKYYHKGAFFQTDDGILQRDFSAPTEQDRLDNSFGRSGRTKWTHLLHEDTTIDWSNPRFPTRKIQLLPLF